LGIHQFHVTLFCLGIIVQQIQWAPEQQIQWDTLTDKKWKGSIGFDEAEAMM